MNAKYKTKADRIIAQAGKTRSIKHLANELDSTVSQTRFYLNRLQRAEVIRVTFKTGKRGAVSVRILPDYKHPNPWM